MGKARTLDNGDVQIELELRRVLMSYVTIYIDGKPIPIQIASLVNKLAWGLVRTPKARHLVADKKFAATKLDVAANGDILITYILPENAPQKGDEDVLKHSDSHN
jgi:hypothetical protein